MANPSDDGEAQSGSQQPAVEQTGSTALESLDPERAAAEWLHKQVAAERLSQEPSPGVIAKIVRIVGPTLRRIGVRGRKPAA